MKTKSLILFIVSVIFIIFFAQATANRLWITQRIWPYMFEFWVQKDHLSLEDRREYKYRGPYVLLTQIAKVLDTSKAHNPVLLLPPNSFIKAQHVDLRVPEPVVVYYYTGCHAVWTDSPNVDSANWALLVQNGKVRLAQLTKPEQLQQILAIYKNYTPKL